MKNFKDLIIWQKGMDLVEQVYRLSREMPADERYGLTSQMLRASVSIPANIAEGSGRGSDKQLKQFFNYALGSSFELETELLIIERVNLLPGKSLAQAHMLNEEIQRMGQSFLKKLR